MSKALASVSDEIASQTRLLDAAKAGALDPLGSSTQARRLRDETADIQFEIDRLERLATALRERHATAQRQEQAEALRIETQAAIIERDALADDIRALYPVAVAVIVGLCDRIEASDKPLQGKGSVSAEALGRGSVHGGRLVG